MIIFHDLKFSDLEMILYIRTFYNFIHSDTIPFFFFFLFFLFDVYILTATFHFTHVLFRTLLRWNILERLLSLFIVSPYCSFGRKLFCSLYNQYNCYLYAHLFKYVYLQFYIVFAYFKSLLEDLTSFPYFSTCFIFVLFFLLSYYLFPLFFLHKMIKKNMLASIISLWIFEHCLLILYLCDIWQMIIGIILFNGQYSLLTVSITIFFFF